MIKLFIDSDIILDILLQRQHYFEAAADLYKLCGTEIHQAYTSVHSILNVHYVARKIHGERLSRQAIQSVTEVVKVVDENGSLIQQALLSDFPDFEDAVQYFAALSVGCDYIVTRNIKDYKHSVIPVTTAEQFLKETL
jgi:predicted nucleic acid-binding protein